MSAQRLALLGIMLGLTGAVLLAVLVTRGGTATPGDVPTTAVWVATDEGIPAGTPGEDLPRMLQLREVPADVVPARAVEDTATLLGQRAARTVGPGEILTGDQFAAVGPALGGVVVPEGWEAVSVEAQPAPGLEGYATPGSLVNLYVTATTPVSETPVAQTPAGQAGPGPDPAGSAQPAGVAGGQPFTQLVLGHTEVLAVTRGTLTGEAGAVDPAAATTSLVFLLKVRPADVPTLVFAEEQGHLWFSLAHPDDPPAVAERVTFETLEPGRITQSVSEARTQLETDQAEPPAAPAQPVAAQEGTR